MRIEVVTICPPVARHDMKFNTALKYLVVKDDAGPEKIGAAIPVLYPW